MASFLTTVIVLTISLPLVISDESMISKVRYELFTRRNYDRLVRPVNDYTKTVNVNLSLSVVKYDDLDIRTQTLTTEAWIGIGWIDENLRWDTSPYAELDNIRVSPDEIWIPDISVYNSLKSDRVLISSFSPKTLAIAYSNGSVVWVPPITIKTACPMNLRYYPYDCHTCQIMFGSWTEAIGQINVTRMWWSNSHEEIGELAISFTSPNPNVPNPEWHASEMKDRREIMDFGRYGKYATIIYEVKLTRARSFYAWSIAILWFLSILLTLKTLSFHKRTEKLILGIISLSLSLLSLMFIGYELFGAASSSTPILVKSLSLCGLFSGIAILMSMAGEGFTSQLILGVYERRMPSFMSKWPRIRGIKWTPVKSVPQSDPEAGDERKETAPEQETNEMDNLAGEQDGGEPSASDVKDSGPVARGSPQTLEHLYLLINRLLLLIFIVLTIFIFIM